MSLEFWDTMIGSYIHLKTHFLEQIIRTWGHSAVWIFHLQGPDTSFQAPETSLQEQDFPPLWLQALVPVDDSVDRPSEPLQYLVLVPAIVPISQLFRAAETGGGSGMLEV